MKDVDAYYFSFLFFPMIYNSDLSNPKWMNLHFFTKFKFSRLFDSTRLNDLSSTNSAKEIRFCM